MKQKIKLNIDQSEMKKTIKKAKRLRNLLKEANSLADELASKDLNITISM